MPRKREDITSPEWQWGEMLGRKGKQENPSCHGNTQWHTSWAALGRHWVRPTWLQRTESRIGLTCRWRPYASGKVKRSNSKSNYYTVLHPKAWRKSLTSKKLQFVIATHSTPATLISLCITLSLLLSGSNANIFLQKKSHSIVNHSQILLYFSRYSKVNKPTMVKH